MTSARSRPPVGRRTEAAPLPAVALSERVWTVVDSSFDVVHVLDGQGNVVCSSSSVKDNFGFAREELVGRAFTSLVHPADRQAVEAELASALASPGTTSRFRLRRTTRSGEWVEVEEELSSLDARPGSIAALVLIGRDVQAHVALNVEFRNLTQALNTLVAGDDAVARATDEVMLLEQMCRAIVEQGGYTFAWVGYAEHDRENSVRRVAQWGASKNYPDTVRITWGDEPTSIGPGGTAIKTGQAVVVDDMLTDPIYARWRERALAYGHRSGLAVPLRVHGEVIGVLGIYSVVPSSFDQNAVAQLCRLGEHLAVGIERLRDQAQLAATLTGTISSLHERLDEAERRRVVELERNRIAEELRRDLEEAVFGIGERVTEVLDRDLDQGSSAEPLLEARRIAAKAVKDSHATELSARQEEIIRLVAEGCSNREIGAKLHLSENTIKTHLQAIFSKLSVRNRAQAAAVATNHRLTDRRERPSPARDGRPRRP